MKRIALIAAAAALAAAPAVGKTAQHAGNTPAAPASLHYIAKDTPNLWRTSEIKGVDVYNDQNQKIGSIDDVLVDQHGNVKAVVIGVGGFLGVGERNVAVPFSELHWQMNTTHPANGQQVAQSNNVQPARASLPGVTREQLQQAPEFKYAG
jgi:hypothetical protein